MKAGTAIVLGALALCVGCGSEPDRPSGRIVFERHCASCHGLDGKGHGPVAETLHTMPPDLTQIAKSRGGKFDEAYVIAIIDGRTHVAAHGPRDMPVWGSVFESELTQEGKPYPRYTTYLRVRDLADYLRSIQE